MDIAASMPTLSRRSSAVAVAALFAGAVVYVYVGAPAAPLRTLEFAGLMLAAILTSGLRLQQVATNDRAIMPPSFVFSFAALLLFGPRFAMLAAAAGALTPRFESPRSYRLGQKLLEVAIVVAGVAAARPGPQRIPNNDRRHRVAMAGPRDRRGRDRISGHPGRAGRSDRAVARAKTVQPVVAEARVPRLSAVHGRSERCRGPRRSNRSSDVGGSARDRRLAVFRLSRLRGLRHPARRRAPPSEVIDSLDRACGWSTATAASRCGMTRSNASWAARATGRSGRSSSDAVPALGDTELPRAIKETLSRIASARTLHARPAAVGDRRAGLQVKDPAGCRRGLAAVARRHRAHARGAGAQAERRAARARGGRRQRRPVAVGSSDPGVLRVRRGGGR